MKLLDGLLSRLGYTKAVDKIPQHASLLAEGARYSLPSAETYIAQATLYQKLTWIATAIDIYSEVCAIAKFSVKQKVGEEDEDIPNHPFELRLQEPNQMQSEFEFKRDYFAYRKLTGNVYVYLNRKSKNDIPAELWIIPTHLIRPIPDGNSYIKGYLFDEKLLLEPWQVMHDKTFNPLNPFIGM